MKARELVAFLIWLALVALLLANLWLGVLNAAGDPGDAVGLLTLLGFGTVGVLIVARRPDHLIGWLFCLDALLNSVSSLANGAVTYTLVTQPGALPGAAWFAWIVAAIGDTAWALLYTFTFLLFPTGRLPSPRWRPLAWLIAGMLVFHTLVSMFQPGPFTEWPTLSNPLGLPVPAWIVAWDVWLDNLVVFIVLACIASLVVRFRTAQSEERQQIKWMVFVAAILLVLIGLATVLDWNTSAGVVLNVLIAVAITAFPLAVGISILRYRLWDIDVLIRRTLIYGALTAALALLYAVSTVMLQQVFRSVTSEDSQLVIVLSTLLIAAIFAPLRRRIQGAIDRRFYRRTVDAAQTLAAFGAAARDEVDLDRLTQALLDSVETSFQPAHTSLWLPHAAARPQR